MENTGVDMSDMTVKQMTDLANFFKDIDKATSDLLFELIYKTGLLEDIITSFSKLNNNKIWKHTIYRFVSYYYLVACV